MKQLNCLHNARTEHRWAQLCQSFHMVDYCPPCCRHDANRQRSPLIDHSLVAFKSSIPFKVPLKMRDICLPAVWSCVMAVTQQRGRLNWRNPLTNLQAIMSKANISTCASSSVTSSCILSVAANVGQPAVIFSLRFILLLTKVHPDQPAACSRSIDLHL